MRAARRLSDKRAKLSGGMRTGIRDAVTLDDMTDRVLAVLTEGARSLMKGGGRFVANNIL